MWALPSSKGERMTDSTVWRIEPGLYLIDQQFLGVRGVIGSYLLSNDSGDELALIETGPAPTLDNVIAGVRSAGFDPACIRTVIVTHIHLDHAGAAGVLLRQLPDARVLVHPNGAEHLVDPSRLLKSAGRIYGDDMERLWGEVLPVPEDRVQVVRDRETIQAAGRKLTAISTPGHAGHHHAWFDPDRGDLFTGDAAAVRLERVPYVRPPAVPPEFDLDLWKTTIGTMRSLQPRKLHLTHFGSFDDPEWHFDDQLSRMYYWYGWVNARLQHDADEETLIRELREFGDQELVEVTGSTALIQPYELATAYFMTIQGMARYYRRKQRG
jgi:glyoxylase-like metal-dependent hydrolase (beta-lactamase superfamily II)